MTKTSRLQREPAGARSERRERERRLAAALRDNLRRRKQQAAASATEAGEAAPAREPGDDGK